MEKPGNFSIENFFVQKFFSSDFRKMHKKIFFFEKEIEMRNSSLLIRFQSDKVNILNAQRKSLSLYCKSLENIYLERKCFHERDERHVVEKESRRIKLSFSKLRG